MKQFKRLGGDDNLGYFTEWEKNSEKGCIYCGNKADTREHTPSKAFLDEPFPENLPTIPACFKCNNGFSNDENYVACYLDLLKSKVYKNYTIKDKTQIRLDSNPVMKRTISKQICIEDEKVHYTCDENKLVNVLVKLARSHAGYEFDYVDFDGKISVWYEFSFNLNEDEMLDFDTITPINKISDIGSRVCNRICVVEDPKNGQPLLAFLEWVNVQQGQYRYNVYFNEMGQVCVKIVIGEFLFCIVKFV